MIDHEFINLSIAFAMIGIHATADAILATDPEDDQRIVTLANEAQYECYQRRLTPLDEQSRLAIRRASKSLGEAYSAVNQAMRISVRRARLKRAERNAETLVIDACAASAACMEAL